MAKRDRHAAILRLIREERISSQEMFREHLLAGGFDVTQATLSRDIRVLRLVKVPAADGTSYYTLPEEWETTPPLEALLPTLFISVEHAGNLMVVKTMTGGAQAVGIAIDWEEWPEVLGTVAGDDTILIVLRDPADGEELQRRIESLIRGG